MARLFIFGIGYSAARIAALAKARGWAVTGTGRGGGLDFAGDAPRIRDELATATHVLSSVPPDRDGDDPVLAAFAAEIAEAAGRGAVLGYLSSTGVYGDTAGGWVDESAPVGGGRRTARAAADARWLALGARAFRLPGIYGPGRSALDRVRTRTAHRIDMPGQVFSRIHVDDLAAGVVTALATEAPPGAYNLADDLPTSQNAVIEEACRLLGLVPPPLVSLDEASLSPMARGFFAENRRVANGKAKRLLGWRPRHPTYREGLAVLL